MTLPALRFLGHKELRALDRRLKADGVRTGERMRIGYAARHAAGTTVAAERQERFDATLDAILLVRPGRARRRAAKG